MTPFKEVAMLTSSLLARKGAAAPASLALAPLPATVPPAATAPLHQPVPPRLEGWLPPPFGTARPPRQPSVQPAPEAPRQPADETPHGKLAKVSLRLDTDRHLKLRLAAAHQGRSGQQLLLSALDAYLDGVSSAAMNCNCTCLKRKSGS
jgi:hypothetical protein